jgi:ribonuclease R
MAAKCEKCTQEVGVADGKPRRGRRAGGTGGRLAAGGRREGAARGGRGGGARMPRWAAGAARGGPAGGAGRRGQLEGYA